MNALLRRVPVGPLYALSVLPAGWYFWLAVNNRFGPDPVNALEREYGLLALQLLVAALLVTPVRALTGVSFLRFRRMLGVMAFVYAGLHVMVWLVLDRAGNWDQIVADLTKRPYVIIGMLAFLMLIPLAASSNDWSVRRLGAARWRRLHRLAYPATALAAVHYVWLVKAWPPEPLLYAAAVAGLLVWRARGWTGAFFRRTVRENSRV